MAVDRSVSALDATTSLSLASVRRDGRPHVVPLWFIGDGETIVASSKPHALALVGRTRLDRPRLRASNRRTDDRRSLTLYGAPRLRIERDPRP
jgi:predicted pyridoxine 5'-phosphate oxidase superfamily flavin-nucleotide-binding protein